MFAAAAVAALAAAALLKQRVAERVGGTPGSTSGNMSGNIVDIYSSLPMQGSSSAQTILGMVNGIKLALSQANGKAGDFTVRYTEARRLDRRRGQVESGPDRRQRA